MRMESMLKQRYKREQEEFVSNHGGSKPIEVILILIPSILAISLTHLYFIRCQRRLSRNAKLILEILVNIMPFVLCSTIWSEYTAVVGGVMILLSSILCIRIKSCTKEIRVEKSPNRIPFITNFRALTNIITAICILAVDFKVFPRKFAKTESYGVSLMDTGVGFFVMANGLVSKEARDCSEGSSSDLWKICINNVTKCAKTTIPLFLLGFIRCLTVEYFGYQMHVTEYGIHWNFFITLAVIKIFTSIIATAIRSKYAGLTAIWIIGMHEYALSTDGIKEWILGKTPRVDFISANREGLASVPGYVGLYLMGIAFGRIIHMTHNLSNRHLSILMKKAKSKQYAVACNKFLIILMIKLFTITFITTLITVVCNFYFGISRRLANAGYCAWIIFLTSVVLNGLLLVDILFDYVLKIYNNKPKKNSSKNTRKKVTFESKQMNNPVIINPTLEIFEAVNYNGLIFFVVSNLMTGLINRCIHTLYVHSFYAVQIIMFYIIFVISVAVFLYRHKVQLKW